MPEKKTIERARRAKREGKSPSTQAGEFVREEIHHVREGKHGARSAKQAIAMIEEGYVTSLGGKRVAVAADTMCLHGDQPGAVTFAKKLRETFKERGISVAAP